MEKLNKNSTPVLTPVSAAALPAEQNKTPVAKWTPEEIAEWGKMLLDGARNRHLNNPGQSR